jgi:hypothetical protein
MTVHVIAGLITYARCGCGAIFEATSEREALEQLAEHVGEAETRRRHPSAPT